MRQATTATFNNGIELRHENCECLSLIGAGVSKTSEWGIKQFQYPPKGFGFSDDNYVDDNDNDDDEDDDEEEAVGCRYNAV